MINLGLLMMTAAGIAVSLQVAVNARLSALAGSALWAANISFAVTMIAGVLALALLLMIGSVSAPAPELWGAPWWLWLGGLGGATYVLFAILLAPRLGTALLSAAGIVGQLAAALAIDHYGWFGMPVHRLSAVRVLGVALLAVGAVLIRWK